MQNGGKAKNLPDAGHGDAGEGRLAGCFLLLFCFFLFSTGIPSSQFVLCFLCPPSCSSVQGGVVQPEMRTSMAMETWCCWLNRQSPQFLLIFTCSGRSVFLVSGVGFVTLVSCFVSLCLCPFVGPGFFPFRLLPPLLGLSSLLVSLLLMLRGDVCTCGWGETAAITCPRCSTERG